MEIRKRKFSRKTWPLYRRILVGGITALGVGFAVYEAANYLLYSPGVQLRGGDQIEVQGSRFVPQEAIAEKFSADMGHSVVRVPLTARREEIESIPWVEVAHVQRVMPNKIRVEITERTPVAFLRTGSDLSLIDAQGVILERPVDGEFKFPVVGGMGESMLLEARGQRMNLYVQFMKEIEQIQPGADDHVSEADLSDATDLRGDAHRLWERRPPVRRPFLYISAILISAIVITCLRKISISGEPAPEASIRWIYGLRGRWW